MDWQASALYMMQDPGALQAGRTALRRYRRLAGRESGVEARMLEHIGTYLLQCGEYAQAIESYREAAEVAGSLLDLSRLANIYHGLAESCRRSGQSRAALDYMERAVNLHRTEHDVRGGVTVHLARLENDYGLLLAQNRRFDRAEEMIRAALDHYAEMGVEGARADALNSMGALRQLQGQLGEAMNWTLQAIELAERLNELVTVAESYQQLGELHALNGDRDRFEASFARALEVIDDAGLPARRTEALARFHAIRDATTAVKRPG
jgi:tetratricopeptide (TPR) repeat protein